jgi:hypothetical protein
VLVRVWGGVVDDDLALLHFEGSMDMSDHEEVRVEEPVSVKKEVRAAVASGQDLIAEVNVHEVLIQMREIGLKLMVLGAGAVAGVADLAGMAARGVQSAASRRLRQES